MLLNVWHAPSGLVGILAFILLGAVLMFIILVIAIIAWFRRMSSATLVGMLIGAAIGAAIDSGKWKIDWEKTVAKAKEEVQKNTAKTESE